MCIVMYDFCCMIVSAGSAWWLLMAWCQSISKTVSTYQECPNILAVCCSTCDMYWLTNITMQVADFLAIHRCIGDPDAHTVPTGLWIVSFELYHVMSIWVKSRRFGCIVTWFWYQLIAKPGNKTAAPSWLDPYHIWTSVCFSVLSMCGFLWWSNLRGCSWLQQYPWYAEHSVSWCSSLSPVVSEKKVWLLGRGWADISVSAGLLPQPPWLIYHIYVCQSLSMSWPTVFWATGILFLNIMLSLNR